MSTLEVRLVTVLQQNEDHGHWSRLERLTGISSQRWRKVVAGLQRPTSDMVEAACKLWPEYAFWISTGITDPLHGHIAPNNATTEFPVFRGKLQIFAQQFFKKQIELQQMEAAEGGENVISAQREEIGKIIKEKSIVPALYLSYEAILNLYNENGRYEYYGLISNEELNRLQKLRESEEIDLIGEIKKQRNNIAPSEWVDEKLKQTINLFKNK